MLHTPSGGARVGTAARDAGQGSGPMSIGAVLQALREEFPEVTVSKIRFLEAEGLVEPARTPAGYRKFRAEDVERLSHVLRMQRDHYLPLKVIREQLEGAAHGSCPSAALPPSDEPGEAHEPAEPEGRQAAQQAAGQPAAVRLGREELLAAVSAAPEELAAWEEYGLLRADAEGGYGHGELAVARLVAELGRHGLEARHLRALKLCAERQLDLAEQTVASLRRHPDARTRELAQGTVQELAGLSARLYTAFVQAAPGTSGD
ncbi:MerR family transcriptional regulator [Streptomyces tubbatahanensis]|uniref:MerR family transcriptional regulator n=1 Tax=Streptomyces tubbatahanensis TaxID=2923272 RepID=A0ABY3XN01_9ACTN|nr:MerR family transcriptional regulator [Streptomyces tubbatahanensis]UNS95775.1 MerR family transcriptional regulator [Streptomyces tubbatahanensis]